jgi:hypothetical protein
MNAKETNRYTGRSWYLSGGFPDGTPYTEKHRLYGEIERLGKCSLHSPNWMHTSRLGSLKRAEAVAKIMLEHGAVDVYIDERVTETKRTRYEL